MSRGVNIALMMLFYSVYCVLKWCWFTIGAWFLDKWWGFVVSVLGMTLWEIWQKKRKEEQP